MTHNSQRYGVLQHNTRADNIGTLESVGSGLYFADGARVDFVEVVHPANLARGATHKETRLAIARRLVACWNACEGLTLETLESFEPGALSSMFARSLVSPAQPATDEAAEVMRALRDVLPYAESRLEDMEEAAADHECENVRRARVRFNAAATLADYPRAEYWTDEDDAPECEGCDNATHAPCELPRTPDNVSQAFAFAATVAEQSDPTSMDGARIIGPAGMVGMVRYAGDLESPRYELVTNSQDVAVILDTLDGDAWENVKREDVTGALVVMRGDDYAQIWLTEWSRPFDVTAQYTCVWCETDARWSDERIRTWCTARHVNAWQNANNGLWHWGQTVTTSQGVHRYVSEDLWDSEMAALRNAVETLEEES